MSQPSTQPSAVPHLDPAAVRIVLFGLPDAGKSSLLGALAQAAQTQEHVLSGRLVDPTQGLADLRHRVYDDKPRETLEEIVSYPVTLEPSEAGQGSGRGPIDAVLIDCDGRVANALLARQDFLRPDGNLARAILEADTLVLVVDASATPAQLERDFGHFIQFLALLEKSRAQRNDVGGLPVYLVLTKCDLLAQKSDATAAWIDHIEERKRQVGQRFQEFLTRQTDHAPLPFGSIDLHLWATAVGRPALADAPAKPREPYGVAELFRQCLESAQTFEVREGQAGRRLKWTVLASAGFLALLAALALVILALRPADANNPLEQRVEYYRTNTQGQSLAARVSEAADNLTKLQSFQKDSAEFDQLPPATQAYIKKEYHDLKALHQAYQAYVVKLKSILPPQEAVNRKQLEEIEDSLDRLPVPAAYRADWPKTPAGKIAGEWQNDINLLRVTAAKAASWYHDLYQEARTIDEHKKDKGYNAFERAGQLWNKAQNPPFPTRDPKLVLPGAYAVTYGTVYRFNTVQEAHDKWDSIKDKIKSLAE